MALCGPPPNGGLCQSDRLKGITMVDRGLLRKTAKHDPAHATWGCRDLCRDGADRDAGGAIGRKTIDASRDRRISDRGEVVFGRERQSRAVAGGEQVILAFIATAPHWANRVDHMLRLELIA